MSQQDIRPEPLTDASAPAVARTLADRHEFLHALEDIVHTSADCSGPCDEHSENVAVLFCGLDGVGDINKCYGHETGDHLIDITVQRLREVLGAQGTIARFGAQELAIIVPGAADASRLVELAYDMVAVTRDPVRWCGAWHQLTMTVGIARHQWGNDIKDVIRNADLAMNEGRRVGAATVTEYSPRLLETAMGRARVRSALHEQVATATPELRFQPIIRLSDGAVTGVEALSAWRCPDGHLLDTDAIIEIAESTGAVIELGNRMIRESLAHVAEWRQAGHLIKIAVNVSARHLLWPGLVETVSEALRDTGVEPQALVLEVTETTLVHDFEAAAVTVRRLRDMGVQVAIDDFGTGYAGLDYLRRLPVDVIKIDKSFLRGVGTDPRGAALLHGMIRMVRDLGMQTVCEGAESLVQVGLLREAHCDFVQGYLLSAPLPAEKMLRFLERGPFNMTNTLDLRLIQGSGLARIVGDDVPRVPLQSAGGE